MSRQRRKEEMKRIRVCLMRKRKEQDVWEVLQKAAHCGGRAAVTLVNFNKETR